MPRSLAESVVVVTGASSGIGRGVALQLARRGAAVVLAARRAEPLHAAASQCEELGARALAVPTDVADEAAVGELARRAVEAFGRIDAWVSNAGVYQVGTFEQTPADVFRQVLEVNFLGAVHGARAVLPIFRTQASGVLVNNASLGARVPYPYVSAYAASKAAMRAWALALRQELRDLPEVHVCTVLPAAMDTPLFVHSANYTGRALKPLSPTYEPDRTVGTIVALVERPRREVVSGSAGRLQILQHTLAPRIAERLFAAQADRDHFYHEPAPDTAGAVFAPVAEGTGVDGGYRSRTRRFAVAAAAPAAVAAALLLHARTK